MLSHKTFISTSTIELGSTMEATHISFNIEESNTMTPQQNFPKPRRPILASSSKPNKNNEPQTPMELALHGSSLAPIEHTSGVNEAEMLQKDSGRERLKRHREEVAGQVLIPDTWGKEGLLKDWIDYSSFDALLAPTGIASAREALVAERSRTSSQRLRIESRC